ncbi:Hpt domain-containing protein [Roseovarius sp. 2305UL8-3]|uniref:Hpt domain-containing protein n=1 Tax=Roseovarius conchicola TaxID=3121636 RepID=UPI003529AC44
MINWARVSELRDEIGAEDFGEVVEIFLEEVEEEIAALRDGIETRALESKLHFLKGSALNLGFADFAAICQAGERAAASGHYDAIDLPAVLGCYADSKTDFLGALDSLFAA